MNNIVRLKVFEDRVLRKTFGPKRKGLPEEVGVGEDSIMSICVICTDHHM